MGGFWEDPASLTAFNGVQPWTGQLQDPTDALGPPAVSVAVAAPRLPAAPTYEWGLRQDETNQPLIGTAAEYSNRVGPGRPCRTSADRPTAFGRHRPRCPWFGTNGPQVKSCHPNHVLTSDACRLSIVDLRDAR